jgi:hypothetical protein
MPKKAGVTTKEMLKQAPLPMATSSYTVISHDFVMSSVEAELAKANLKIERELYKMSSNGQIASGVLHLNAGDDQEMRMMFAWANSYDKSMRFKCAIGGYLTKSGSIVVSGNMGTWGRKHTGTADQETLQTITHQIESADVYYSQLLKDKENMKNILLTERERAAGLGVIYFEHGLLNTEQTMIIKDQMKKPSYDYNCDKDSLWALYCNVIYSLQKSHPKTWLDQQRLIHFFLCDYFNIESFILPLPKVNQPEVTGGYQMTIHDVIAEEEASNQIQM